MKLTKTQKKLIINNHIIFKIITFKKFKVRLILKLQAMILKERIKIL